MALSPLALSPLALLLGMALAPGMAKAQGVAHGPGISGADTRLEINQIGQPVIGAPGDGFGAEGNGLSLTIRQVGTSRVSGGVRTADAPGSRTGASRILVEQRNGDRGAVAAAEARLLVGLNNGATAQDIAILQRGAHATAEVRVATTGPVHGLTLALTQAAGASAQIDVQSGLHGVIAWNQGAGAQGSLTSSGDGLTATIAQAAGSRVAIANAGNNNTYAITTQQAVDQAVLGVTGHNNTFNLDFQGYREVAWRNAATNGGTYSVVGGDLLDQNNRVVGAAAVIAR